MEQATQKQIEYAKRLGIETPEKYDKQALRGLIDVKLKEQPVREQKTQPGAFKSEKSYHLTPEQIRTNALNAALKYIISQELKATPDQVLMFADLFYPYLIK